MAINWNQIKADFGDANSAMRNSQASLSQAGTVFGDLRKAVLDEEQRAVENAFKLANFNLDKDKLAQAQNQFDLSLAETIRANQAKEQHQADVLAVTKAANESLAKYRDDVAAATKIKLANDALQQEFTQQFGTYNAATPEQKTQIRAKLTQGLASKDTETVRKSQSLLNTFNLLDGLAAEGKVPTQANIYQTFNNGLASFAGIGDYKAMADAEKNRTKIALDRQEAIQNIVNKDMSVVNDIVKQHNLAPEAASQVSALASIVREIEPNADMSVILPAYINTLGLTEEWWGDKNVFNQGTGIWTISDLDSKVASEDIAKRLASGSGLIAGTKAGQKVTDFVKELQKQNTMFNETTKPTSRTAADIDRDMLYETLERLGIPIIE